MDKEAFWEQLCAEIPSLAGNRRDNVGLTRANLERLVKHAFDQGYVEGRQDTCETPAVQGLESIKVMSLEQLEEEARKQDEKMDRIFEYDAKLDYITINAAGPYHIALKRILDPEGLAQWVEHLSHKNWMTSDLIGEFIRRVCSIKGWNLYQRDL
jgi:hypothetical protein